MAPKRAQPGRKASAQPKPAAATGLQRSPIKPAKKKATNSASAPPQSPADDILDGFDEYRQWVRRANNDAQEISFSQVHGDWQGLPEDHAAAFAVAVRAFQGAEPAQTAADFELRKILQQVSNFQYGDVKRRQRDTSRAAQTLYSALIHTLRSWRSATGAVLSRLYAVESALATMPQEGLHSLLETYQKGLREQIEAVDEKIEFWIDDLRVIPNGDLWTFENFERVQDAAKGIKSDLSIAGLSSLSPAESSSSSSKRKREGDAGEPSPRAPRVIRSGNARSGAAPSHQRSSEPRATSQNQGQVAGDNHVEQAGAAPGSRPLVQQAPRDGTSTSGGASKNQVHASQASSGSSNVSNTAHAAPPQPLPLPTIGVAGEWTELLRRNNAEADASSLPFLSWCRRQLITANYRTLEECEPLVHAFYMVFEQTLGDHDWQNELDIPSLPFTPADFQNGRMLPNVRRLLHMIRNAPGLELNDYVIRNVSKDGHYFVLADFYARQLIGMVLEKGLAHDWETERDFVRSKPPLPNTTNKLPLESINGHWNHIGVVGEGGNGRAVLYCKLDGTGNILQRVISKESFVGIRWNLPTEWYGPVRDRMPKEAGIHSLFPKHQHIIEYLGFHVNKPLRMVRLYTAFAELGDLLSLLMNHSDMRKYVDDQGRPLQAPPIPIVAALYIFEALAAGVCLMANGTVPDDKGRWTPPWDHNIIHRDIKAQNYFLSGSTSSGLWPKLPIAALGDFGNAFDQTDPQYANTRMDLGTDDWMAPEQLPSAPAEHSVTAATNVYQIGLVMLQVMLFESPQYQTDFAAGRQGPIFLRATNFYPRELVDMAYSCIAILPEDRPAPLDLYVSIRDLAKSYPEDGSSQLPWQLQTVPPGQRVRTKVDKWATYV